MTERNDITLSSNICTDISWSESTSSSSSSTIFTTYPSSSSSDTSSTSSDDDFGDICNLKVSKFVNTIKKYSNANFKRHFRMSRTTANIIIDSYKSEERPITMSKRAYDYLEKEVYIFLWYAVNPLTYKQLGSLFDMSKKMASTIISRVSTWMVSVSYKYIKWPSTQEQIQQVTSTFEINNGIGDIIGVIGATHIKIAVPFKKISLYINKYNYCSIILQAVVDHEKRILDIYCGEPGSNDYNRVLHLSHLYRKANEEYDTTFPNNTFLLGGNEYKAKDWLVTPFTNNSNSLTDQQRKYNYLHWANQIKVQLTFDMLKTRFRRLLCFTEHTNIDTITNTTIACCVLHNLCLSEHDYWITSENDEDVVSEMLNSVDIGNDNGMDRRAELFDTLIQKGIL